MKQEFCRREILAQLHKTPGFPYATPKYWWFQFCVAMTFVLSYSAILFLADSFIQVTAAYLFAFGAISILTLSVGHQALHGALFKNRRVSRFIGLTIFTLVGVDGVFWSRRHIRDHHPHPNTKGHDGDIDSPTFLRLAPYTEHRFYHRYQHWYAPILYCVGTLITIFLDDIRALLQEMKCCRSAKRRNQTVRFVAFKLAFVAAWLLIPALNNASVSNLDLLLAFCIGTIPTGWLFLPVAAAHLNTYTKFIDDRDNLPFVNLQAETTVDFNPYSTLVTMVYGGLNCHLAHHLFPSVASCHYAELYRALKLSAPSIAAQQRAISLLDLFRSHFKLLKLLGTSARVIGTVLITVF